MATVNDIKYRIFNQKGELEAVIVPESTDLVNGSEELFTVHMGPMKFCKYTKEAIEKLALKMNWKLVES